jgi:hypothetical protein
MATVEVKAAYSIDEFCRRNSISTTTYHKLQAQGVGPRVMRLAGTLVRISADAEREWQLARENPVGAEAVAQARQAEKLVARARRATAQR